MNAPGQAQTPGKRPRDPRLDFFRGCAMFIILLAHTPGNTWTLWIPARFGFSDATEIFVFCSGMASALAFGAVFATRGFFLGTARIAFRVWQVYWAHVGVLLVTAIMLWSIDAYGLGARETPYINGPYVRPLFEQTGEALTGLFTLTWVTGLFDILPMYLAILAMVPLVMAVHRAGGRMAAFALILTVWGATNLAGYARMYADAGDLAAWQSGLVAAGEALSWLNLPGSPWGDSTWFFNPFAWQIVFFLGFSFGMGWLPAPPVSRRLVWLALGVVLINVPLAWYKIHGGWSLIADTWVHGWINDLRAFIEPMRWKTWQGLGRWTHFLALAYLAWVAVGPRGVRLSEGFAPPRAPAGLWLLGTGAVALVTLPVAYPVETGWVIPGYEAWLKDDLGLSVNQIGMGQLAHLVALIVLVWAALGPRLRTRLTRDAFTAVVPVIRKVGTQSLAVFVVSLPLARLNGWVMDVIGRDVWTRAGVNLAGFAILIAVAYVVGWFKRQPWREAPRAARQASAGAAAPEPDARPAPAARA